MAPRHRFQFIKRGSSRTKALRGRGLGAWYDIFSTTPSAADVAPKCIEAGPWAVDPVCQSYFPNGPQDAIAALPSGCAVDTSSMTAKMNDLQTNWNPSGVYSSSDLRVIVGKVMAMVNAQHNAVMTMQTTYDPSYLDSVGSSFLEIGKQAVDYTTAANTADAQNNPTVNAQNLKPWVIAALSTLIDGMNVLGAAACSKPFWLDALASFDSAVTDAWGFIKTVGGLALSLAKSAVQAVEEGVGFVAWLVKWAPWLAGGLLVTGIGFYAWNHHTRQFPSLLPGSTH